MGTLIVKQPNGKLALFSTVVDQFVLMDASREDVVAKFSRDAITRVQKRVAQAMLDPLGEVSWEQALGDIEVRHGRRAAEKERRHGMMPVSEGSR